MARGILTPEIKELSKKLLGYTINQKELILMPYIQYVMMNEKEIDMRKLNYEEIDIVKLWEKMKFIEFIDDKLKMTKEFWDSICQILWLGYANIK